MMKKLLTQAADTVCDRTVTANCTEDGDSGESVRRITLEWVSLGSDGAKMRKEKCSSTAKKAVG